MKYDTIAAIATALGESALNIIRISGPDAFELVKKIWRGPRFDKAPSHTIHYGHVVDGDTVIDEVLLSVFRPPRTFTTEPVVEISCHGGPFVASTILELLVRCGVRLAEKGEFTERAFLHGRIDLTQAESIVDIIASRSRLSLELANKGLDGRVRTLVERFRNDLLAIVAQIEVNIDYPEYDDVEQLTTSVVLPRIDALIVRLLEVLTRARDGQVIREGVKTAIIGRPNVGKSSLLNALIGEDKAIVTDIHGTTRDLVEASVTFGGITLHLVDTAGIREAADKVEKIGIEKARQALADAELILFVLDNNVPLSEEDERLLDLTAHKKRIVIINKIDLESKIGRHFDDSIPLSALNKTHLDALQTRIRETVLTSDLNLGEHTYVSNARQIARLHQALAALEEARRSAQARLPVDMVELDLKHAWAILGEIIGDTQDTALLDALFSRFCLGK
ncbi:MAG: tRNA uridine-5-carboxymethylaminomethyl(34) synthesis GTPase MnmE [Acholeplasmatales bacterium]|nr:MAG: tRNA uridine-5-carboxymethylaminomethyl(34) synthesis GTPase MnmE [Acholeplasmatales bacterium]